MPAGSDMRACGLFLFVRGFILSWNIDFEGCSFWGCEGMRYCGFDGEKGKNETISYIYQLF